MSTPVAAIDIGSNSIKVLVAAPGKSGHELNVLHEETLETRISKGIAGNPPRLLDASISAGVEAVRHLDRTARELGACAVAIAATSAVRSAVNGNEFIEAVQMATAVTPQIMTGDEEAETIALGVRTDPQVAAIFNNCCIFDLGGGSLEWIRIQAGKLTARTSLPLGVVRLTEKFISDPGVPVPPAIENAIYNHVVDGIRASAFPLSACLIGCSGGLSILRQMFIEQPIDPFAAPAKPFFSREFLLSMGDCVLAQTLDERIAISRLPRPRADIFPAAFITYRAILDACQADGVTHSAHNLRFGMAARLLGQKLGN